MRVAQNREVRSHASAGQPGLAPVRRTRVARRLHRVVEEGAHAWPRDRGRTRRRTGRRKLRATAVDRALCARARRATVHAASRARWQARVAWLRLFDKLEL